MLSVINSLSYGEVWRIGKVGTESFCEMFCAH